MKATFDFEKRNISFEGPISFEDLEKMFELLSAILQPKQTTTFVPYTPNFPVYPYPLYPTVTFTDSAGEHTVPKLY